MKQSNKEERKEETELICLLGNFWICLVINLSGDGILASSNVPLELISREYSCWARGLGALQEGLRTERALPPRGLLR